MQANGLEFGSPHSRKCPGTGQSPVSEPNQQAPGSVRDCISQPQVEAKVEEAEAEAEALPVAEQHSRGTGKAPEGESNHR